MNRPPLTMTLCFKQTMASGIPMKDGNHAISIRKGALTRHLEGSEYHQEDGGHRRRSLETTIPDIRRVELHSPGRFDRSEFNPQKNHLQYVRLYRTIIDR